MKIDSITWEKAKTELRLYKWPSVIFFALQVLSLCVIARWPMLSTCLQILSMLVMLPTLFIDTRCRLKETAREKRELQEKYDAEDRAMFGKPLRDIEL